MNRSLIILLIIFISTKTWAGLKNDLVNAIQQGNLTKVQLLISKLNLQKAKHIYIMRLRKVIQRLLNLLLTKD